MESVGLRRDQKGDLGTDVRIILKWIMKKVIY
jgi:hypothetical protein